MQNWQGNNKTLERSILDANQITVPMVSYPAEGRQSPGWIYQEPGCDGTMILFKPENSLKLAGFGGLKFAGPESFNRKADW